MIDSLSVVIHLSISWRYMNHARRGNRAALSSCVLHYVSNNNMYACSNEVCHVVDVPTFFPPSVLTLYSNKKKLKYSLSQFAGLRFITISIRTCSV